MIKNERINYLDIAKGIAIVLVVLGHSYNENPVKVWLYSFHLPLFFFVSGCLLSLTTLDNIDTLKIIKSKAKSILIPYISFSIIIFCIWIGETYLMNRSDFTINAITSRIISISTFRGIEALWFLPCLFAIEVIFILMIKYLKSIKIIAPIIIVLSILPFIKISDNLYYIEIMRVFVGLAFLSIGYYAFKYINKIDNIIIPIGLLIINITLGNYNGFVDIYSLALNNYFIYYISAFCGIVGILIICKKIKQCKPIEFLGANSLIIFATHLQVMMFTSKLVEKLTKHPSLYLRNSILWGIIVVSIIIIVEIPIVYITKKWFPIILGKSSK